MKKGRGMEEAAAKSVAALHNLSSGPAYHRHGCFQIPLTGRGGRADAAPQQQPVGSAQWGTGSQTRDEENVVPLVTAPLLHAAASITTGVSIKFACLLFLVRSTGLLVSLSI
eukprot:gene29548-5898_t